MHRRPAAAISIPVEINPTANEHASLTATSTAILRELESMLETLASSGVRNSMDLRRAPLAPRERRQLKATLGQGEVRAEMDSCGPTQVYETAVPGIWWIRHCNQDGDTLGEFIEVTAFPEILESQPQELRSAASRLRARISQQSQRAPDPKDVEERLAALGLSGSKQPQLHPRSDPSEKGSKDNVG